MNALNFANAAIGSVASSFDSDDTTISLSSGHGNRFPVGRFRAVVYNSTDFATIAEAFWSGEAEVIEATGKTSSSLTGLTRGLEGTTPLTSSVGHVYKVVLGVTAGMIANLMPVYSVASFGAVNDGTTDNTGAFNLALAEAEGSGGIIYVPPGDYLIDEGRLLYESTKAVSIHGAGWHSRIIWVPATDAPAQNKGLVNIHGTGNADANHCSRVSIRDLYFDFGGSRAGGSVENKRGLNLYNCDNINVEGCYLKGSIGECIGLGNFGLPATPGNNALVRGNTIFDFAQDGINSNNFNCIIDGNVFKQGVQGIEAGRDHQTITNNYFEDMDSYGISVNSLIDFVISHNRLIDSAQHNQGYITGAIEISEGGGGLPCYDGVIAANHIHFSANHAWNTAICAVPGALVNPNVHSRVIISNNVIYGAKNAIYLNYICNSFITGNLITANSSTSAIVIPNVTGVANNKVSGNYASGTFTGTVFEYQTTGVGNEITHNFGPTFA